MLLKPEPIFAAVEALAGERTQVILLSPQGRTFNQAVARELSAREHLVLVCGSYEGFDERIREALADDELSIGDYVLTNGALPAMVWARQPERRPNFVFVLCDDLGYAVHNTHQGKGYAKEFVEAGIHKIAFEILKYKN